MKQPERFVVAGQEHLVLCLKKALYGLKQAPRRWYLLLHDYLLDIGFRRCAKEYCLYVIRNGARICYFCVYVDDILLASNATSWMQDIVEHLETKFKLELNGPLSFLLKIEIKRNVAKQILTLSQRKYIEEMLDEFGLTDCNGKWIPAPTGQVLPIDMNSQVINDPSLSYRQLIGKLRYLVHATRPDIGHAVRHLSQFLDKYTATHWELAKHVLKYLKTTANFGLVYDGRDSGDRVEVVAYCDADFANDVNGRKSVSGHVLLLANGTVSFGCAKQHCVAQSSTESEYVSAAEATKTVMWARDLLKEMELEQDEPTVLFIDNQSAIAQANNPEDRRRSKHIGVRYHLVRDSVEQGVIQTEHARTDMQVADIFTKPLARTAFERHREALGVKDLSTIALE